MHRDSALSLYVALRPALEDIFDQIYNRSFRDSGRLTDISSRLSAADMRKRSPVYASMRIACEMYSLERCHQDAHIIAHLVTALVHQSAATNRNVAVGRWAWQSSIWRLHCSATCQRQYDFVKRQ